MTAAALAGTQTRWRRPRDDRFSITHVASRRPGNVPKRPRRWSKSQPLITGDNRSLVAEMARNALEQEAWA